MNKKGGETSVTKGRKTWTEKERNTHKETEREREWIEKLVEKERERRGKIEGEK